jgi:bifunctional DNase/RNase
MEKKKVSIKSIEQSITGGLYNVFLKEDEGSRMLNVMIGEFEAKKMSMTIDNIEPPRPLTYDLFYNVLNGYGIKIQEVIITKFYDGVYFSSIICFDGEEEKTFDARTSDAINMALKYKSPIFASEEILNDVGFLLNEAEKEDILNEEISFIFEDSPQDQISELEHLLDIAVEKEDYDLAATLRDKIDKQKEEQKNKDKK